MKQGYLKYILALLLFGTNGIVASHIHIPSYEIVLLRTLIGNYTFTIWHPQEIAEFLEKNGFTVKDWRYLNHETYVCTGTLPA